MTRLERLLLLVYFGAVVALLVGTRLTPAVVGAVAGAGAGVLLAGRLRRLSTRMDRTLGAEPVAVRGTGREPRLRPRSLALRAGAHVGLLLLLLVGIPFLPFVGDEVFVAVAAAATGLPAVLTVAGLRRRR